MCVTEVVIYLLPDNIHDLSYLAYIGVGLKVRAGHHILPVAVIANETGFRGRHFLVHNGREAVGESFQHFSLGLGHLDVLEIVEI